ncbi:hypothetical protein MSG28_013056, partial [Choristoneura fumiferana]
MKLDSNNKLIRSESGSETPEDVVDPRQNAEDIIDEILAEFTDSRSPDATRHGNGIPDSLFNMIQPPRTRTPANSFSETATLDDIDPASDLGASIRNKCLELEEILQSLKSRLNHVVLDENIVLSPDANSMEAQLEHDLDTDCQEDLSLQEFLELLHSQNEINPTVMYKYISVGEETTAIKKIVQNEYISKRAVDSETWLLQGVLVATRHGDRGPLTHLRGGDRLPCDTVPVSQRLTINASSLGRAWWVAAPGPFHNFPALPPRAAGTRCALGQLTPQGLLQMLTL